MQPNGYNNRSDGMTENKEDLLKQIDALKSVIHQKTLQLNQVIQTSERKYSDIHDKYRLMANELHESWKYKYQTLEKENEKLLNCLSFLINKNKNSESLPIDSPIQSLNLSNLSNISNISNISNTSNNNNDNNGGYVD